LSPQGWLALVWAGGVLLLLARRGWLGLWLSWQRRSWQVVSDPKILQVFEGCQRELGLAWPVRLVLAPELVGPAASGVWRARIVLPHRLVSLFSAEELRLVLLHELLHVRRLDVLTDRLAALLAIVHWFNPVAWLALARLRRERELACDAAVLDRVDTEEGRRYGHLILKSAEHLRAPLPLAGAVEMFGPDLTLARRIHMIASHRKPTKARQALGSLLVVLLVAVGLTDARPPEEGGKAGSSSAPSPGKAITVAGVCQDETGEPLKDVKVAVYRQEFGRAKAEQMRETTTDAQGRFRITDLAGFPTDGAHAGWVYVLACTRKGRASAAQYLSAQAAADTIPVRMPPAATLQGRVTDPDGKPVAGAWVWALSAFHDFQPGILSSRTDADGRYAITDMRAWDVDKLEAQVSPDGRTASKISYCTFRVRHPDFAEHMPAYKRVPNTINVTLQPAGILEGRVIDQVTGKPAAHVVVSMQGTRGSKERGYHETRTDREGKYRIPSLAAASYNVWAHAPDRACVAIDSFPVTAGKTHQAPDLKLIEGGWIEGRLIDAETRKPVSHDPQSKRRLAVASYGPGHPKSGAACQSSEVDDQGAFRMQVAPGLNFPYIMFPEVWNRTQRREFYEKGIEVKSGEVVSLVFRILPKEPIPDPEPAPVRLQLPVAEERQTAERVRQLGGWYQVDRDRHVVEVNMVYHETPDKVHYDNKRKDTDEALRTVKAFPRLKRLMLSEGQATDEGLASVAGIEDLEALYVWNAHKITDAGIKHLVGLARLREIHISDGHLGDGALKVFARLPKLERLSLQQNDFSNEGLKHLAGMKRLRALWVGMSRTPFTDAGVKHLAGLTKLEQLDLQGSSLSDDGVASLKGLKDLKTLYLDGGKGISDASVDALAAMTQLQELALQNTRITERGAKRLVDLPKLKSLILSSSSLSQEAREELKKRRPELRLYVSGPTRE
jgi:5-hydroxyisourate hydrolase-like protein (transthyretin family)